MRILEICLSDYLGGLELYFIKCSHKLSENNEVFVAYRKDSKIANRMNDWKGQSLTIGRWNRYFPLKQAIQISRFIRKNNISLIHAHHSYDLLLCGLVRMMTNTRLVYTRQMEFPFSKHDPYHSWLYHRIDLLLVITRKLLGDAQKYIPIPKERIKLLYYGVAPSENRKNCGDLESWSDQFKIGVISRIQHSKGQHQVVEAVKILKQKNVPVVSFFYGDVMVQEDMDKLEQMVSDWDLSNEVHFKGFSENPRQIMGCFDLVVQPSKIETFGLVLIEAMREGTAVAGTNSGGIPEIIDHDETGCLFEFEDSEGLADVIEDLYRNTEKRLLIAQRGKEKADREFDEEAHFSRLEKELKTLANV